MAEHDKTPFIQAYSAFRRLILTSTHITVFFGGPIHRRKKHSPDLNVGVVFINGFDCHLGGVLSLTPGTFFLLDRAKPIYEQGGV